MIRISADSTADLDFLFEREDIPVVPLYVVLNGKNYRDGVDVTPQMIFDTYQQNKVLPKTAAVGIEEYKDFFKQLTDNGDEVIHFCISSNLSASYSNALTASKEFKGVYVVDSRVLSTGIGLLALKAVDLRNEGKTALEIFDSVKDLGQRVQCSFVVDTLEFLHKGGRCSSLTKLLAGILKIRPVLQLKNGNIEVGRKFLGSYSKSVEKYIEATLKSYDTPDLSRIFITHTYADEAIVDKVNSYLTSLANPFKEIIETKAGCTVTSHCGKGTIGILYIN